MSLYGKEGGQNYLVLCHYDKEGGTKLFSPMSLYGKEERTKLFSPMSV